MLLLINSVQAAIGRNESLSSLKASNADLSFINNLFVSGLPKSTLLQNFSQRGSQFIKKFDPTYPSTKHATDKKRIVEVLGRDIYHAAKVKGCIKDRLKNLSNTDFVRLQTRCNKIRSPQHLLGVFAEIMHEGRRVPLLKEEQLERLLSSWPELRKIIDKAVQAFQQKAADQKIKLREKISLKEEQLFVIQTLYDLSSENNITPEKWNDMDKARKEGLFPFISEGNINVCLNKRSAFENALFGEGLEKQKLEEFKISIYQDVKVDLYSLEFQFITVC